MICYRLPNGVRLWRRHRLINAAGGSAPLFSNTLLCDVYEHPAIKDEISLRVHTHIISLFFVHFTSAAESNRSTDETVINHSQADMTRSP